MIYIENNKKMEIMPYKTRQERLNDENQNIRRIAQTEEDFLKSVLPEFSGPYINWVWGCGRYSYKGIVVDRAEYKTILILDMHQLQNGRENLMELATDILKGIKIARMICSGVKHEEITALKQVVGIDQETIIFDDSISKDTLLSPGYFHHLLSISSSKEAIFEEPNIELRGDNPDMHFGATL